MCADVCVCVCVIKKKQEAKRLYFIPAHEPNDTIVYCAWSFWYKQSTEIDSRYSTLLGILRAILVLEYTIQLWGHSRLCGTTWWAVSLTCEALNTSEELLVTCSCIYHQNKLEVGVWKFYSETCHILTMWQWFCNSKLVWLCLVLFHSFNVKSLSV